MIQFSGIKGFNDWEVSKGAASRGVGGGRILEMGTPRNPVSTFKSPQGFSQAEGTGMFHRPKRASLVVDVTWWGQSSP